MPEPVTFQTKPEIALAQITQALADGVPQGMVLMDAGYGVNTALRDGVTALGLSYVAGVLPQTSVWAPGATALPPKPWTGRGRPPKLMRRDDEHQPVSVKELAVSLPQSAFETIVWREGAWEPLSSRFARVRVCPAHRDDNLTEPRPEEWLLIEWPEGEAEPAKYWFSTLPEDIDFTSLAEICAEALVRYDVEERLKHGRNSAYREFVDSAQASSCNYSPPGPAVELLLDDSLPPDAGSFRDLLALLKAAKGREALILNGSIGYPQRYRDLILAMLVKYLSRVKYMSHPKQTVDS